MIKIISPKTFAERFAEFAFQSMTLLYDKDQGKGRVGYTQFSKETNH
jgi:hypothetical protein